jgi:dsDNA-specific endonuclease/ATPase MutS2
MRRFRKTIRRPETLGSRKRSKGSVQFDYVLDLHGHTCDEGVSMLNSVLSSHSNSSILTIHGKGAGVLRRRIRAYLSKDPRVKKVELGEDSISLGGDGVTVVYTH